MYVTGYSSTNLYHSSSLGAILLLLLCYVYACLVCVIVPRLTNFEYNSQFIDVCLERLRICVMDIQEWFKTNDLL